MKLIRHLTPAGPAYAVLQPDGSVRAVEGDILGEIHVTDRIVTPGKILAPLDPVDVYCIGANYRKHIDESGPSAPQAPVLFLKPTSAVQNPNDPIRIPVHLASQEVDYEGELAVVIGKRCKNATRDNALDYVFGYTCANDVTARDWQKRGGQWCTGKGFDTFCPLGPVLVTRDEIPDPNALTIRTTVNGELRQECSTAAMIADVRELICFLSGSKTLQPGSVILTGTPHGVGAARTPPVFLRLGDVVAITIDKIGTLSNPVVYEPGS